MAVITFCALINVFLAGRLPLIEALVFVRHVLGVSAIIIPLWLMAPHGNAFETVLVFTTNSGWEHLGLASVNSMVPMIGMLIGYDCSIHMSEEVQDASKTVPLVLVWAVTSNAALLIVVAITFIFCIGDMDSVLNTPTYVPAIQVFYNATQSTVGTSIITAIVIINFVAACVGQVATASRHLWSFS